MRIAIIGSGVAGLTCAHVLHPRHDVTVYETDTRPGGHAHTVGVNLDGVTHRVDTGFLVYNERNYPAFTRLLRDLGVATRESDMSFSVIDESADLEWCGTSPRTVFAQPANVARREFWRMLSDVVRFNRLASGLLDDPVDDDVTLATFLTTHQFSRAFRDWYLIPMGAAIWSADPVTFDQFPVVALARFFANHGLLSLRDRPQWRGIVGGSERYVRAITERLGPRLVLGGAVTKLTRHADSVDLVTNAGRLASFDHVIVATHSDQALALLSDGSAREREILGALRYRSNEATLHTDASLLPRRPRARASWNWQRTTRDAPTLTYDLSRLQGLDTSTPLCLTLNRAEAVAPRHVLRTLHYDHPIFDGAALRAQRRHGEINGDGRVSFAGAYWGYGFHEDGVRSAIAVCHNLGVDWPGVTG